MPLTRYGIREWGIATIVAIPLVLLFIIPDWYPFPGWILSIPVIFGWCVIAAFFRDPIRPLPRDMAAGTMLSPADGVISAIEHVDAHEATNGQPAIILRIFLSVLNVHVNRAPCDCTVLGTIYRKGKFLNAQTAESAQVNESNVILLEFPDGEAFGMRQVSGMIARCIVCPLQKGDTLTQGCRWGMIKFGSTTELILPRPDDVEVHVQVGDRVTGARTTLARLKAASSAS
ncbi:MAG: phosphatidylserine decarboxylase [Phycisphaerales bacterium]|nr:phosphatidylserine decarboxylase [Phycisphaerales bacterium]